MNLEDEHEELALKYTKLLLQYKDLQSAIKNVLSSAQPIGKSGAQLAVLAVLLNDLKNKVAIPVLTLKD